MVPYDGNPIIGGYVIAALMEKYVGIQEMGNGVWRVFYRNTFLVFFVKNI